MCVYSPASTTKNVFTSAKTKKVYAEDRRSGIPWPICDVPFVGGSITISPQECNGNCVFDPINIKTVMTPAFRNLFSHPSIDSSYIATQVILESCKMIHETFEHPDYIQVFVYEKEVMGIPVSRRYWAMHSDEYITFMVPDDY